MFCLKVDIIEVYLFDDDVAISFNYFRSFFFVIYIDKFFILKLSV